MFMKLTIKVVAFFLGHPVYTLNSGKTSWGLEKSSFLNIFSWGAGQVGQCDIMMGHDYKL